MRTIVLAITLGLFSFASARAEDFGSTTIDLGMVVGNLEKSADFYTKVVGFKEVDGFEVPGDFAKEAGLTDGTALKVRVFVLGEGKTATKLKLMELPATKPAPADSATIHSRLGFRYLTIMVTDTTAALERLAKNGIKTVSKGGAVELPKPFPSGVFLTVFRDPDGNLIEFVGPKK